jgi:hypothetical protein
MVASETAKMGEFATADLRQFLDVQDGWDIKIARSSKVPLHWLIPTGTPPSGDSLKTAESGYVAKERRWQTAFTPEWAAAMAFGLTIESTAGDLDSLRPIWANPESQPEGEQLDLALKRKAVGVPDEQIWAELGYTVKEREEFKRVKQDAFEQQQQAFARSFDRGETAEE